MLDVLISEQIAVLQEATHVRMIHKGFSTDQKYVVDDRYLVRIFPVEDVGNREKEFNVVHQLCHHTGYIPKAIMFGKVKGTNKAYMVLEYLPGTDGEQGLPDLTIDEQYAAGMEAGVALKEMHALKAPIDYPHWYDVKRKKSDNYLRKLSDVPVEAHIKHLLKEYIKTNEALLKNRPNTFQHDDFHPANLLIHQNKFAGIIDFGRMDWGDPVHDLHKLGFFSSRISIPFTRGIVEGYHEKTGIDMFFWQLYALYSAMHIVSSLVWGLNFGPETFQKMKRYSYDVLDDHDNFSRIVPKWYEKL